MRALWAKRKIGYVRNDTLDSLSFVFRVMCASKSDKSFEECEDVYGVSGTRAAVADGATEYFGAKLWGRALVSSFLLGYNPLGNVGIHRDISRRWKKWMEVYSTSIQDDWFGKEKIKQGAAAAFLGIELHDRSFKAVALGDCCFFHVSNGETIRSWPFHDSNQFGSIPSLVTTSGIPSSYLKVTERFEPGDQIFLCTDAISKWILSFPNKNELAWKTLLKKDAQQNFHKLIDDFRSANRFRLDDDDVTVIAISL